MGRPSKQQTRDNLNARRGDLIINEYKGGRKQKLSQTRGENNWDWYGEKNKNKESVVTESGGWKLAEGVE